MAVTEPAVKKYLYWCENCNIPLIGRRCGCGSDGVKFELLKPYDIRPALKADHELIKNLLKSNYGTDKLPEIVLLNKTGGIDRVDLIICNGRRFGWLIFDPVSRTYSLELEFDALPALISDVKKGITEITDSVREFRKETGKKRIGGKKFPVPKTTPEGSTIVKFQEQYGIGVVKDGHVRVKNIGNIEPASYPDPSYATAVKLNRLSLKNLERTAVRSIKRYKSEFNKINVSFSGGKDSTVVKELARRAGVDDVYFVDTGMEFPETIDYVNQEPVFVIKAPDFWKAVKNHGIPHKDDRWCCEYLKLKPVKDWLSKTGKCATVQGNRWYESFARADIKEVMTNPYNQGQINISPIRNWRALEVFFYIWWRGLNYNPLYDLGFERVGCWNCPAMLESEYMQLGRIHPELKEKWDSYLHLYIAKNKFPDEYVEFGLWRWEKLPPKWNERLRGSYPALFRRLSVTGNRCRN